MVNDGLANLQTFHLKKYLGKSGQEHEIDVSFEVSIGQLQLIILVECKDYKRKVGLDDVMNFAYRLRDIGAHKGILVTPYGFQKGAIKIAKSEGISLLIVAQRLSTDCTPSVYCFSSQEDTSSNTRLAFILPEEIKKPPFYQLLLRVLKYKRENRYEIPFLPLPDDAPDVVIS